MSEHTLFERAIVDALTNALKHVSQDLDDAIICTLDAPPKEAFVDVTSWAWRENGPYAIEFVAQDQQGRMIASTKVNIYVK